ncbi:MAG TPA: sigma-54 dependent transcriptional regulator [Candidatus Acidoferrales bacterium]|nr:sigma-54 dependent transcriptional regulator [Candidatus Acidoferrales bacterium]
MKADISILAVDDDVNMLAMLEKFLKRAGYTVDTTSESMKAMSLIDDKNYDIVITDIQMPRATGMDILRRVKELQKDTMVVIITAFGSVDSAVNAMKAGAYDYVSKPFNMDEILALLERATQQRRLQREVEFLRQEVERKYSFSNIIGKSKAMQDIFALIQRLSHARSNVLITGRSGTGKEMIAKALHYNSDRRAMPFVTVNCSAIPESLLESELFGHEKGAFTGAITSRRGLFETANGGTLFLDEIGDMPLGSQSKLLRVVESGEVRPVGSDEVKRVDVRVIAATHRDLKELIKHDQFREDLFYRLNVISIHVPDLKDRPEDITILVDHFMKKYGEQFGKPNIRITHEASACLLKYTWPGNVRELENIIERSIALSSGEVVDTKDLPEHLFQMKSSDLIDDLATDNMPLTEVEKRYIVKILQRTNWHQSKAAQILGIDRKTLYRKIKEYNLVQE